MERHNGFYNAGGGASWGELVAVGVDFGIQYFGAKAENRKDRELLERMAELDVQQAEKLKKLLNDSLNDVAKTQVIINFLDAEKIKTLEAKTKQNRIISLIVLGVGVIAIGIILYKLNKRNG